MKINTEPFETSGHSLGSVVIEFSHQMAVLNNGTHVHKDTAYCILLYESDYYTSQTTIRVRLLYESDYYTSQTTIRVRLLYESDWLLVILFLSYLYTSEIIRVLRQSELNSRVHLELHATSILFFFYVCTISFFIIIIYVCTISFFLFLSFTAI